MNCYKLSAKVLSFIRQHRALKEELCTIMGIKGNALDYHLDENRVNGRLTNLSTLEVISKYFNEDITKIVEKCQPETVPA